ncbi:MAG: hypothetical protein WAK31_07240 [Chthoniobacterales bacterium]
MTTDLFLASPEILIDWKMGSVAAWNVELALWLYRRSLGFEPTMRFPVRLVSSHATSATKAPVKACL